MDDNFFERGGHSLKATIMASRIHKELNVKIPLAEIFRTPTVRYLSRYITEKRAGEEQFTSIGPTEKKEYYELSSAQKRLYILQQMELGSNAYNNMRTLVLEGELEQRRLQEAFRELIKRHESLRTSFEMVNGKPVQRIHEFSRVEFEIRYYQVEEEEQKTEDRRQKTEDRPQTTEVKTKTYLSSEFIQPFDLSKAPLLRVGLIGIQANAKLAPTKDSRVEENEHKYILVVNMHHIITDGISRGVFERDFLTLYAGNELPGVRLQYRDYSGWQNNCRQKISLKKQEQYWLSRFAGEIPVLNMPTDYPRPPIQRFEGSEIYFEINRELTARLKGLLGETDVTLYMILVAAYNILLSKYTGQEVILVGSPVSGRTNIDLHQVIGLFANMLVMKNMPNRDKTFQQFLEEIKQHALQAFENQDYPFNELVEKLDIPRTRNRHPLIDTVFTMQNSTDIQEGDEDNSLNTLGNIKVTPYKFHQQAIQHELLLSATERRNNITMMLQYSTVLFKESTARRISKHYIEILEQITQNPNITLRDIKISIDLAAMPIDRKEDEGDFDF
jgi:hypothetical protein